MILYAQENQHANLVKVFPRNPSLRSASKGELSPSFVLLFYFVCLPSYSISTYILGNKAYLPWLTSPGLHLRVSISKGMTICFYLKVLG